MSAECRVCMKGGECKIKRKSKPVTTCQDLDFQFRLFVLGLGNSKGSLRMATLEDFALSGRLRRLISAKVRVSILQPVSSRLRE